MAIILKTFVLILFLNAKIAYAAETRSLKLLSCSTSGKSLTIQRCEIADQLYFSIDVVIFNPLPKFNVLLKLSKLEGSKSVDIFKVPTVEWCNMVGGKTKTNRLAKTFLDQFRRLLPKTVQQCPIKGRIEINNLRLYYKMMMMFPSGIYNLATTVHDDVDDQILRIVFEIENV